MRIGIFYHEEKVERSVVEELEELFGGQAVAFTEEEQISKVDRLVVLGGDGAVLRAARRASEKNIPLVGVNYGTVGFLTEFERGETAAVAELVLNENCDTIKRAMLEVEHAGLRAYCLNELALMRRIAPDSVDGVVRIRVNIDGSPAGEFGADGLIVSTPTGSTAYSLSAGGSILTPDCEAFLLTPVCAFSMKSRPIICSDKSELTFTFPENHAIVLHGDGKFLGEVGKGDLVTVRKSQRSATFLTKGKNDFFRRLTEKIN